MVNKIADNKVFDGGYFVLNKMKLDSDYLGSSILLYTLKNSHTIKDRLLTSIRNASKVIKLCSFILTDKEIVNELENKCKNSDVPIFILTQLDEKNFSFDFSIEENVSIQKKEHMSNIANLYNLGVHIRATKSAHAKFLVCDHESGILMSANITPQSLNSNPETGLVLQSESEELDKLFDILYLQGTEYVGFNIAKNKQLISARRTNLRKAVLDTVCTTKLKFTWENLNNSLYKSIVALIEKAESDIYISTYSVVGLDKLPELVERIKSAIDRGLKVKLFCRAMNHRQDHLDNCLLLKNLGVEIFGDYYNHSKGIYSGDNGIIFTANIDGDHGLNNGFEVGSIMNDEQLIEFKKFLEWQFETAPFHFEVDPYKETYFLMYNEFCAFKNITRPILPSKCTIQLKMDINHDLFSKPIYLLTDNDQKILKMKVSHEEYEVEMQYDTIRIKQRSTKKSYDMNSYLLQYEELTVTQE